MNENVKQSISYKWILIVLAITVFSLGLSASEYYVIKDPKPTVTEDKVVYLEEVKTIAEDLGKGQFLFHPRSVAADKSNIFVYDSSQAIVFRFSTGLKLLGHFGRTGEGPGEFSGKGKFNFVQISVGVDGNLYANDLQAFQIIGFDREGKHLKTFKYGNSPYTGPPVVDKDRNIMWVTLEDREIQIINEKHKILHHFPLEKIHYGHLVFGPSKFNLKIYSSKPFAPNTSWALTKDSKLLILFKASASMAVVDKNNGYLKTMKLWPKNLIPNHKKRFTKMRDEENNIPSTLKGRVKTIANSSFLPMFGNLITDQDDKDIFYLQAVGDWRNQKIACILYAFNLDGHLLKVIRLPIKQGQEPFTARINAKVNHIYYAIRGGDTVTLYKEKKQ